MNSSSQNTKPSDSQQFLASQKDKDLTTTSNLPSFLPCEQKRNDSPDKDEKVQTSDPLFASNTQTQNKSFAFTQAICSDSESLFSKPLDKSSDPSVSSSLLPNPSTDSTSNLFNITKATP